MLSDFAKEKVFWTQKMNINLVRFIEGKPSIWNPKHPRYTSVECRDRTYAEFAEKYGDQFTGQAVKERWTNIRSTFANYLRKIAASRMKDNGEEYTVNWHLWEHCQFLKKVNRKRKAETSTSATENGEDAMNGEDEETEFHSFPAKEENEWSSEDSNMACESSNADNNMNPDCTSIVNNLVTVFKGVQNDAFGLDNSKNGKIGRAVNRKLSQMNSYDAARVSHKIMEILLLYDENNPLNPNRLKSDCL